MNKLGSAIDADMNQT